MKYIITLLLLTQSFLICAQNNYSIKFDGINDFIEIPDHNSLKFNQGNFTIFGWIKLKTFSEEGIFDHFPGTTSGRCNFRINVSGQLHLSMRDNNSNDFSASTNSSISDTNWHFYSVTFNYSSKIANFYLDGQPLSNTISVSNLTTGINPNGKVYIAKYGNPYHINGTINYLSAWNIELDSTQINQYMVCPPIGNEAGLVGFWDLDEGMGTIINDQTIFSNNGTLNGGGTWVTDLPPYDCKNTSILEFNKKNVNLFPNPTYNEFSITISEIINGQIILTDISGKKVMSKKINANKVSLNLERLESKGIYFVKIIDNSGNIVSTNKVIYQ